MSPTRQWSQLIMWPFTKHTKRQSIERAKAARLNLTQKTTDLEIRPGFYAVVFVDTDIGSIVGGRPDRPAEIVSIFEDALKIAATNDDEEQVGIFNSERELILWRHGHERFILGTHPYDNPTYEEPPRQK